MASIFDILRPVDELFHLLDNTYKAFGARDCLRAACGLRRAAARRGLVSLNVSTPFLLRGQTSDLSTFEEVFFKKSYFHKRLRWFRTIIDCGANIGCASVFMAREFPDARILAIEPDAANFELLCRNTAGYPNIKAVKAAVWARNSAVSIVDPNADVNAYHVEESESGVPGITLDRAMEMLGAQTVDLIKMDIEGAERAIFDADCAWLSRVRVLMIELHDRAFPGCSKSLYRAMQPYDYVQHQKGSVTIIRLGNTSSERRRPRESSVSLG